MARDFYDADLIDTIIYLAKDKAKAKSIYLSTGLTGKRKDATLNKLAREHIQKQISMLTSTKPDEIFKYFKKDNYDSDFRNFELAHTIELDHGTTAGVVVTVSAVVIILSYAILNLVFGLDIMFTLLIAIMLAVVPSSFLISAYLKDVQKAFFMYGRQLEQLKQAYAHALKQLDKKDTGA